MKIAWGKEVYNYNNIKYFTQFGLRLRTQKTNSLIVTDVVSPSIVSDSHQIKQIYIIKNFMCTKSQVLCVIIVMRGPFLHFVLLLYFFLLYSTLFLNIIVLYWAG